MNQISIPKFGINKIANVLLKYKYQVKTNDILGGQVIGCEKTQTCIDLGLKKASFLPSQELYIFIQKEKKQVLSQNELGEFIVIDYQPQTEKTIVSLRCLHYLRLWERFRQLDIKNMTLSCFSLDSKTKGKLVHFDGLKILVPFFHLPKYYKRKKENGGFLPLKILEIDSEKRVFGSTKLAFFKKQSFSLHQNLIQDAYVLSLKPFGIVLNLYGLKCLLHISEISNEKTKPSFLKTQFKIGSKIKIKVIYINSSQGKIAVSLKQALF